MASQGYIYIPNWDRFQHYKDRRPTWIKLHLDFLGSDAWHELSADDRCLLLTVWMLVARHGNGRLRADQAWLMGHANVPNGPRSRNLERLNHAGFIEIRASKSLADPYQNASPELEGSKEPKKESAASSARRNGAARRHRKELALAVSTASSWLEDEPAHLVHQSVRETWPELADQVITTLSRAETTENGSHHEEPAAQDPTSAPRATAIDEPLAEISEDDIPF